MMQVCFVSELAQSNEIANHSIKSFLPTTTNLKQIRRLAAKNRASRSCVACKKIKRKCGDYRPCPRCIANGLARTCASGVVEMPIPFSVNAVAFEQSAFPDIRLKNQWSFQPIRAFYSTGYKLSSYINIFECVPDDMSCAITNLLTNLDAVKRASARCSQLKAYSTHAFNQIGQQADVNGDRH